eukprot:1671910-Rhodomonas_salina.2
MAKNCVLFLLPLYYCQHGPIRVFNTAVPDSIGSYESVAAQGLQVVPTAGSSFTTRDSASRNLSFEVARTEAQSRAFEDSRFLFQRSFTRQDQPTKEVGLPGGVSQFRGTNSEISHDSELPKQGYAAIKNCKFDRSSAKSSQEGRNPLIPPLRVLPVSYTHLRAHETEADL